MRTVETAEELIACLQESAATRIVKHLDRSDLRAVVEYPKGRDGGMYQGIVVAEVVDGSKADELLDQVYDVEGCGAPAPADAVVPELPLRYGPGCSEWCLSSHPDRLAFSRPAEHS